MTCCRSSRRGINSLLVGVTQNFLALYVEFKFAWGTGALIAGRRENCQGWRRCYSVDLGPFLQGHSSSWLSGALKVLRKPWLHWLLAALGNQLCLCVNLSKLFYSANCCVKGRNWNLHSWCFDFPALIRCEFKEPQHALLLRSRLFLAVSLLINCVSQ